MRIDRTGIAVLLLVLTMAACSDNTGRLTVTAESDDGGGAVAVSTTVPAVETTATPAEPSRVAAEADILVSAIGRPGFVTADFVKPGATVIDVGTTPVRDREVVERLFPPGSKRHDAFLKRGQLVIGDVHPSVSEVAGALSPVPGGVGPLTIAMLLKNTVRAAHLRLG